MIERGKEYFKQYTKPLMAELLTLLKLDKTYFRAEGDFIYFEKEGKEEEVLDLVGGYGSLLLGHNNKKLLKYKIQLHLDGVPHHAQLSIRSGIAFLSKVLSDTIQAKSKKDYVSTFTNSGAEAIEAALKHTKLNYKDKLNSLQQSIETTFVEIENYFNKFDKEFRIDFKGETYKDIKSFKVSIIDSNLWTIRKNNSKILASKKSFHGKTIAALSISSNISFKEPFGLNDYNDTIFFNWDETEITNYFHQNEFDYHLPKINKRGEVYIKEIKLNSIIGVIIEPILGEGGIHVVPYNFLKFLRIKTKEKNIPLIFDEIQCGCYRTGEFLASFKANVFADYYVLGKSLGGGVSKISALLVEKSKYIPDFDLLHTSTFAEDDISAMVSIKTLEIIKKNRKAIVEKGAYLMKGLLQIKEKYPDIITDVRGDGLMLGISFKDFSFNDCHVLQMLSRSNYLGYLLAAYLLNEKGIRVSVTLSDSNTIRIHPSLFISKESMDKFIIAIDELSLILQYSDIYYLISFMLNKEECGLRPIKNYGQRNITKENCESNITHVGFLAHYINTNHIRVEVPSLGILKDETLEKLLRTFLPIAQPVLLGSNCIKNINEEKIVINFVGIPFTSSMIKEDLNHSRNLILNYRKLCNNAIQLLYSQGISTIGLGQFTSIIMHNGRSVDNSNVVVTTGNSFTVFNSLSSIIKEINRRHLKKVKIAVIGANGNIANMMSCFLVDYCNEIILIGNSNKSKNKIKNKGINLLKRTLIKLLHNRHPSNPIEKKLFKSNLFSKISNLSGLLDSDMLWEMYLTEFKHELPIHISCDLSDIKKCNIIVVATNEDKPFLTSMHFKPGTFICDISVPSNCTEELLENNKIKVIQGGVVQLPNGENLCLKGLPLDSGQAHACMSETMIMGFEKSKKSYSHGDLLISQVKEIGELGRKNGFTGQKERSNTMLVIH